MKVFFVSQRVPFPPDRGDKISTFHEIRHLARNHEVHVFCLADGDDDLTNVAGVKTYAKSVTAVTLNKNRAKWRALASLAGRQAFTIAYFREPRLHRAICEKYAALRPDAILVYSSGMAQYAEPFERTWRVMQFGDLDSLKWAQYAERAPWPMSKVYATESRRLLDYERHIALSFDHSIVCTTREKDDFQHLIRGATVSCMANGVDLEYFRSAGLPKEPGSIVFTGVMDYPPNVDAVTWFCDHVFPRVRAAVPGARFTICGSRPRPEVLALANRPGVVVTGRVPEVRPYLDRAEVAVVPLRMARGIQNKLLEAMAMSLPCVVTRAAWEGIDVSGTSGVFVADDPVKFANAVIDLMTQERLRADAGVQARTAVEVCYSWDSQLGKLDTILDATA